MTSTDRYDDIVIGVGAVGSAAAYHLAKRGREVLGIEQFDVPHGRGSSRGLTRAMNPALRKRPEYVPIARRAVELWDDLQQTHEHRLWNQTGAIRGWPTSDHVGYRGTLDDAISACDTHDLPYEVLTAAETEKRFPGYDLSEDYRFIWQPDGGVLDPQECIIAHMNQAHQHGAVIRARERVEGWTPTLDGVTVTTDKGEYESDQLVITAGAWLSDVIEDIEDVTAVQATMGWFRPSRPETFSPDRFPAFGMDTETGYFYGTPAHRLDGIKVGGTWTLDEETPVDPDSMDRTITSEDEEELHRFLDTYLPDADGPTLNMTTCMVTETSDMQYILDNHPDHPQVTVAGAFSGSGFTTASSVGEIVADLTVDGETSFDLAPFEMARL